MRLFIAIDVNSEEIDGVKERFEIDGARADGSKHLTLKFLGEVENNKLGKIVDALSKVEFKEFEIKTTDIGGFPNLKRPRVIYLGIRSEELTDLMKKIEKILPEFKDNKEFKPHLTIARVKFIKDNLRELIRNIRVKEKKFKIKEFKLYESRFNGKRFEHHAIKTFNCI